MIVQRLRSLKIIGFVPVLTGPLFDMTSYLHPPLYISFVTPV